MKNAAEIRKILVRAPNWIGDAVMCLPALEALKKTFPKAEVTVLAKGRVAPVFRIVPALTDVMEYESGGRHKGLAGRIRLAREIRRMGFDLAVLFQNAFDAAFLSFISGIPQRAGYARDFRRRLLTLPVKVTDEIKKKHEVFYYLNIINALSGTDAVAPLKPPAPKLRLKKEDTARASAILKERGIEGRPLAGVAPGASYGPAKRWAPEKFAKVIKRLSGELGFTAIVFGAGEDKDACDKVTELSGGDAISLCGATTLSEAMAVLSGLKVLITNDSGLMHIADALGVPVVAVFGSTDASLTGPLGKESVVISKGVKCSPCFERVCRFGHYMCLNSITPDEVYSSARALVKKAASPA